MKLREIMKSIFVSWDIWLSALVAVLLFFCKEGVINTPLCEKVFGACMTLLSIIFSIYFAAFTVFVASADDDFIRFLEVDRSYTKIIFSFKYTLCLLVVSLIISIFLYLYILFFVIQYFSLLFMSLFVFIVLYALFAVVRSSFDSVMYAELRARFLRINK